MATIQRFDLSFDPVGLWQFDGNLTDQSGNGFTLSVVAGQERYADIYPGVKGVMLINTALERTTFSSTLAITGDLTIEAILKMYSYPGTVRWLVGHENPGGTSADNCLYGWDCTSTAGNVGLFSESGTGVGAYFATGNRLPLDLCYLAVTRTSNVLQFYLNGRTLGPASGTLTTPSGGSSGRFTVGARAASSIRAPDCTLAGLKILNKSLSLSQIQYEYNRTLGTLYGFV